MAEDQKLQSKSNKKHIIIAVALGLTVLVLLGILYVFLKPKSDDYKYLNPKIKPNSPAYTSLYEKFEEKNCANTNPNNPIYASLCAPYLFEDDFDPYAGDYKNIIDEDF